MKARGAALCATFFYLLPIAYTVARYGRTAVYNLFAADAYYYFTIAKNTPLGAVATFDGSSPTNGFQPLWQYILIVVSHFAGGDKETFIWLAFGLNCTLACAAVYSLARSVSDTHASCLLPLFLVPGFFHIVAPERGLYSLSVWRVLNGMETPLSLLFIAAIIRRLVRIRQRDHASGWNDRDYLAIGGFAALAALARLDNIVLVLVLPLYLYGGRLNVRRPLYLLGPPLVVFASYVTANLAMGVPALPVSGSLKTAFTLAANAHALVDTLLLPFTDSTSALWPGWRLRSRFLDLLLGGCLLSLALAAIAAARRRAGSERRRALLFVPLVLFFVGRLSYYIVFVRLSQQGFWYYVDIAAALTTIVLLQVTLPRRGGAALAAIVAALWVFAYVRAGHELVEFTAKHRWCPQLLDANAARITRCLDARMPNTKILDSSDGIFAYFLDFPAAAATGLTASPEGYRLIKKRGRGGYYNALIKEGFVVSTSSGSCNSGMLPARYVRARIRCGQPSTLRLLAIGVPEEKMENEGR